MSRLALAGLLIPIGILGEVYLNITFVIVLLGKLSMFLATVILGFAIVKKQKTVLKDELYPKAQSSIMEYVAAFSPLRTFLSQRRIHERIAQTP